MYRWVPSSRSSRPNARRSSTASSCATRSSYRVAKASRSLRFCGEPGGPDAADLAQPLALVRAQGVEAAVQGVDPLLLTAQLGLAPCHGPALRQLARPGGPTARR